MARPQNYTEGCAVQTPRNLVICLDGTTNQFSSTNTNIIKLYGLLEKSKDQLTFYDSGVGTYTTPAFVTKAQRLVANLWDDAVAWNFREHVEGPYQWLSHYYKDNDKIFIFGFSRGAYAARALAGMLEKVGLLQAGSDGQVPFAYDVYSKPDRTAELGSFKKDPKEPPSMLFKSTFSRKVDVHFVGVWDTVASVGISYFSKDLPFADQAGRVKHFRQALALDEHRAKFQPEFFHPPQDENEAANTHKEVWFAGSHTDVGGGNTPNNEPSLSNIPLRWMLYEASEQELRLSSEPSPACLRAAGISQFGSVMATKDILRQAMLQDVSLPIDNEDEKAPVHESLRWWWFLGELWPSKKRFTTEEGKRDYTYWPNWFQGRQIANGQYIHKSVRNKIRRGGYIPKANLPDNLSWQAVLDGDFVDWLV